MNNLDATYRRVASALSAVEIGQQFHDACREGGIPFSDPSMIADGDLHRVHVEGDKRGTKNGAYILHSDGNPAGFAMHWRTGLTVRWTASGQREPMSFAIRAQIEAERQRRHAEQVEGWNDAADRSCFIWYNATPITDQAQHPYLITKRVQPHNLRLEASGNGALLLPIYSPDWELVNLQRIFPDGQKRFLSGGRKKGCFSVIGKPVDGETLLICEGWSTGASLHEVTGHAVIVALDAGNLEPVSRVIRGLFPTAKIIIMGDNDVSGAGQSAARVAALACNGVYKTPTTPGHDWNDSINAGEFE